MSYIAFIDMVGTKNYANYDAKKYMDNVVTFQQTIVNHVGKLKKKGKIFFFSDCAYIESDDVNVLLNFLTSFRNDLVVCNIFLKGGVTQGQLAAITGFENDKHILSHYGQDVFSKYNSVKKNLEEYKDEIRGTLFFSNNIAEVFKMQDNLKGIACTINPSVFSNRDLEKETVESFYIKDPHKNTLEFFRDIRYSDSFISGQEVIDKVFKLYAISNTYSLKYGRYYLSILVSIINSSNFTSIRIEDNSSNFNKFSKTPPIFEKIMGIKKTFPILYEKAVGLEFIYFTLLNKLYSDRKGRDDVTREVLKIILNFKRFINKYMNSLELLPKKLISDKNKGLLIEDYFEIYDKHN